MTDLDDPATPRAIARHGHARPAAVLRAGDTTTDEVILVFSSGTTGMPKAVRHTHRSIGHATRHWVAALGLGPDDRFQVATPPSHILGLLNLLAAVEAEMAVAPIALALATTPGSRTTTCRLCATSCGAPRP